jgi:hypothetical protein
MQVLNRSDGLRLTSGRLKCGHIEKTIWNVTACDWGFLAVEFVLLPN